MQHVFLLVLMTMLTINCSTVNEAQPITYDLAIKNIKIFDAQTKQVHENKTILIKDDTIAEVIAADKIVSAIKVIEGNNRLVSPGFIDTHVHLQGIFEYSNNYIPEVLAVEMVPTYKKMLAEQYLNYGVTTIIDMGQKDKWVDESVKWQKNPDPSFPNIFINGSSMISDEKRRPAPHHLEIMDEAAAAKKVQEYAAKGLKYMKLYSRLRAPEMKAIIAEATKHNITLNAHVDNNVVTIPQAMDYGVRNFEHFFTLSPSILAYNEHWVLMDEKYKLKGIKGIDDFSAAMCFFFSYIKSQPAYTRKLHNLLDRMSRENATLSTALHVLGSTAGKTDFFSSFNTYPLRDVPNLNQFTPLQKQQLGEAFEDMMVFAKTAHDKGVKLRIGTDCRLGGRALHSEIKLFAKAGFSNADILQIATWNGYKAMKLEEKFGAVEAGKKADLIIFDNNPLEDYIHFSRGKTVIKGGKVHQPKTSPVFAFVEKALDGDLATAKVWLEKESKNTVEALDPYELKMAAYHLYATYQPAPAEVMVRMLSKLHPNMIHLVEESLLNGVGYDYVSEGELEKAIEILKWNTQLYPDSWNVYDSLGEIYAKAKNIPLAIENYEKSIELNPENTAGIKVLKELKEQK